MSVREKRQKTIFLRRTASSYQSHNRRAKQAGMELDYTLEHLRQWVEARIGQRCPYCTATLAPSNFSCDHRTPTGRGGRHDRDNIDICCTRCNQIKGILRDDEFEAVLETVERFDPKARQDVLARLRAGGKLIRFH